SSKAMYDQALKMFDIEIRPFGKGYAAFVTDGTGNPVRYPIRLSEFDERPNFYADRSLNKEVTFEANLKVNFSETFRRELLKALVYQYRKDEKGHSKKIQKGRASVHKKGRKRY
ncbi:MAG: hypothetical protein JXR82_01400, partial [Marinifilaceae bacterium]|nr:hypothetical protein [Marinifilaceae bacterium]